jgi:hypothetical protein
MQRMRRRRLMRLRACHALHLLQEWQRYFQTRQAQVGLVHKLRRADVLWARAIPAGFVFAASVELAKAAHDLLTGTNKKPGF